ncbi:hypothetical protein CHUAL_004585 [Chamberlinius hualienensis]
MEPRWSPASSIIPMEYETGSPESSLERTNDEVRLHHSGRRLPTVKRQTSIYVTTSDEHLDKDHHHGVTGESQTIIIDNCESIEMEELNEHHRKRPSLSMVTLASPEEVSSLEETLNIVSSTQLYPPMSQTVVSAEVHQIPLVTSIKKQTPFQINQLLSSLPPPSLYTHSHSTGSITAAVTKLEKDADGHGKYHPSASFYDLRTKSNVESDRMRATISVEDQRLVSMMESRCRQNSRWLSNRHNWSRQLYDKDDEDSEKVKNKVRYNDTGSIEEITSTSDYYQPQIPTTSDLVTEEDSKDGAQQYSGSEMEPEIIIELDDDDNDKLEDTDEPLSIESRKLWALRATFEEEEDEEEIVETIVIPTISTVSDDCTLQQTPQITTTLESSTQTNTTNTAEPLLEEPEADEESDCCPGGPNSTGCRHLPLPTSSSETRRQSYQNLLGTRKCRQKLESKGSSEKDNSFDSIETEGSSTDASRLDVVTTSMESTTDNTDSTGEGQIHRLQQMKADSGYKSLETNNGSLCSRIAFGRRQFQINTTSDNLDINIEGECSTEPKPPNEIQEIEMTTLYTTVVNPNNTKTASKKRREYTRERQVVESSFGWPFEQEEDILSSEIGTTTSTTSSYVMDETHEKASVFLRFFRGGRERSYRPFTRDFSIDEKSDALYQEFSRRDPILDPNRCRSPRIRSRHRIYQQQRHSATNVVNTSVDGGGCSEVRPNEDQRITTSPHIPIIKVAPENSF